MGRRFVASPGTKLFRPSGAVWNKIRVPTAHAVGYYLSPFGLQNRKTLAMDGRLTEATTQAEWDAALDMIARVNGGKRRVTLGADAEYDDAKFIARLRQIEVTPHVAQHTRRPTALDGRTTRHDGYAISLKKRKCVEQIFGWLKTTAGLRKVRHRGRKLVEWMFTFALAACNLVRMSKLATRTA